LAVQPFDSLRASHERPLFSPTRRPPAPPPVVERRPDPPPPPLPPNVALFAVVVDGDNARAIVRTAPGADVTRVRTGNDIGGWTVALLNRPAAAFCISISIIIYCEDRSSIPKPHRKPL
jgi:hypothetical protein